MTPFKSTSMPSLVVTRVQIPKAAKLPTRTAAMVVTSMIVKNANFTLSHSDIHCQCGNNSGVFTKSQNILRHVTIRYIQTILDSFHSRSSTDMATPTPDAVCSPPSLTVVTGNAGKLKQIKRILTISFVHRDVDLPEIQGTPYDVAMAKATEAAKHIQGPFAVEDVSLLCDKLGGMPGPYIKWFRKSMPDDQALANALGPGRRSMARCTVVFCDGKGNFTKFMGECIGVICNPAGPEDAFGWDRIFEPSHQPPRFPRLLTLAELEVEGTKDTVSHRARAWRAFQKYFCRKYHIDAELGQLEEALTSHPNFPKPGVTFWDIFPILRAPTLNRLLVKRLVSEVRRVGGEIPDAIVGLDSRGFLFGPAMASELECTFVPIRKHGKLPGDVETIEYKTEYSVDTFDVQTDALKAGQNVVIVDDLLATGGTLDAAVQLVKKRGAVVSMCLVVIELVDLKGRDKVGGTVVSLIQK